MPRGHAIAAFSFSLERSLRGTRSEPIHGYEFSLSTRSNVAWKGGGKISEREREGEEWKEAGIKKRAVRGRGRKSASANWFRVTRV